jgi:hypothetical protein
MNIFPLINWGQWDSSKMRGVGKTPAIGCLSAGEKTHFQKKHKMRRGE